jgi:ribosomal-protein-alanine N-acetyltransferase
VSRSKADDVAVRQAEQADLLDVLRIERASFAQPWPFSAFERSLDAPAFLVAERHNEVIGYVVADTIPNHGRDIGHIKDLAIKFDERGNGLGTRLLRQALSAMAVEGAASVKLEVRTNNQGAKRLYRRFGFQARRRVASYYSDGEDAVIMTLDLQKWLNSDEGTGTAVSDDAE